MAPSDASPRRLVLLTALAIVVLLLGDGIAYGVLSGREDAAPAPVATPSPPPAAATTSSTAPAPAVDLPAVILPAPPGFQQIPDAALAVAGPVDAAKLASERPDPASALATFERAGFASAFVRSWQRPGPDDLVTIRLYQFATGDGAARYVEETARGTRAAQSSDFAISGAPDAFGIRSGPLDARGRAVLYGFGRRQRVVVVLAAALAAPGDDALVAGAVRQQLELLGSAPAAPAPSPPPPP